VVKYSKAFNLMKTLLLIDANSLIHRCFHALPPLTNPKGEPVGALYGISNILLKIIGAQKPDYAAACFDRPEPTFRKQKYDLYKAQRPKAPDELISQIINAHHLFEHFSIKAVEKAGFEADDIIGTLAEKFKKEKNIKVIILTGDLDSLQLIQDGKVSVDTFKKGISDTMVYNEEAVKERYGLRADQLIDYKALVGDASDNIPGVPNVGPKTAADILQKYETLDNFFKNGTKEKAYEKIKAHEKDARLSGELATIIRNVPLETSLEDLNLAPDEKRIAGYFKENNFTSLLKRLPKEALGIETEEIQEEFPKPENQAGLFDNKNVVVITKESLKKIAPEVLGSKEEKAGYNLKQLYKERRFSQPIFDIMIASELLGMDFKDEQEASNTLFHKPLEQDEFILKAYNILSDKIHQKELEKIMYEIEMPLLPVIAQMEENGVLIDLEALESTKKELGLAVKKSEDEVNKIIGKQINPNSPKQLLDYFQNNLHLKINSTSAKTLQKANEKSSLPIFDILLNYRELFKLKSTYIDSFKKLITEDGRIHPTFLQLGAATGRLSCQNPNLQNIPQESAWSPAIRNVFVAPKNYSLVSLDYSQIELRVLASLTGDKNMIETFNNSGDIHTTTAEKIFGVKDNQVTPQMRRVAKTLNFGMMYGMGYRAFSQTAKIPAEQAKQFIKKYFEEFSAVKEWENKILSQSRKTGISKNINGRYRDVSQINSTNQRLSSEMERAAKNMPSQSLAADILKLAMIKVDAYIQKSHPVDIRMILSIHDELIFEINDRLIENGKESSTIKEIKSLMDSAYELKVPLKVAVRIGKRWGEMK
jgi:DNA polymerase-1